MIIFAVGAASSLAEEVLSFIEKKEYNIIATYHKKKPKKLIKKKSIKLIKLDIRSHAQLKKIIKNLKLEKQKIVLLNFVVFNEDKLFIHEKEKNIDQSYQINIKSHLNCTFTSQLVI